MSYQCFRVSYRRECMLHHSCHFYRCRRYQEGLWFEIHILHHLNLLYNLHRNNPMVLQGYLVSSYDFKILLLLLSCSHLLWKIYFLCAREVIRNQWLGTIRRSRFLSDIQNKVIIPIIFNVIEDFESTIYLYHKINRRENYAENKSYQKTTKRH